MPFDQRNLAIRSIGTIRSKRNFRGVEREDAR
jgi:hypothetical protein